MSAPTPITSAASMYFGDIPFSERGREYVPTEISAKLETELAEMTAIAKRLAETLVSLNRTTRPLLAVDAIPKAQDDAWAEYGHDSYPKTTAAILEAREKGLL